MASLIIVAYLIPGRVSKSMDPKSQSVRSEATAMLMMMF